MEGKLSMIATYLDQRAEASEFRVLLSIDEIERIIGQQLPSEARTNSDWWQKLTESEKFQQSYLAGWMLTLARDREAVEFYNRWREAMRHDLADKYAFIFALPNRNDYPSDAIGNTAQADPFTAPFYDNAEDFGNQMHELVRRASAEHLSDDEHYTVYKQPYEIGPAAQTWPMFLNLLQQLGPVADVMGITAFSYAVIAGTARLVRKMHRRLLLSRGVSEYSLPKIIYTKPVLAAMCEDHIRRNFHPTAALTIDAFSVDDPTLFASENHPGLREIYIVDCRTSRKTYTFHLGCHGEVQSFVLRQGQKTEVLPNPDLFEVDVGSEQE